VISTAHQGCASSLGCHLARVTHGTGVRTPPPEGEDKAMGGWSPIRQLRSSQPIPNDKNQTTLVNSGSCPINPLFRQRRHWGLTGCGKRHGFYSNSLKTSLRG
jgi:hypothetical protein